MDGFLICVDLGVVAIGEHFHYACRYFAVEVEHLDRLFIGDTGYTVGDIVGFDHATLVIVIAVAKQEHDRKKDRCRQHDQQDSPGRGKITQRQWQVECGGIRRVQSVRAPRLGSLVPGLVISRSGQLCQQQQPATGNWQLA